MKSPSTRTVHRWVAGGVAVIHFFSATVVFSQQLPSGEYATVPVTRVERDRYRVERTDILVHTRHCHAYARKEDALITTRAEGMENMIYFAGGDVCEIVHVERPSDRRFALIDFLIQLGLMAATKGAAGVVPMPKR